MPVVNHGFEQSRQQNVQAFEAVFVETAVVAAVAQPVDELEHGVRVLEALARELGLSISRVRAGLDQSFECGCRLAGPAGRSEDNGIEVPAHPLPVEIEQFAQLIPVGRAHRERQAHLPVGAIRQ